MTRKIKLATPLDDEGNTMSAEQVDAFLQTLP